jgi:flagellar biosynthesis/type III secretory pathway chaperone
VASLVDTLIEVLNKENDEYLKLLELSTAKTDVIVKGDLEGLNRITDKEQDRVNEINELENRRMATMQEIAKILNTDVEGLKLSVLIGLLNKTPREQKELAKIHDTLKNTLREMKYVNERNEELLNSAIEMVNFNLTLMQSMKQAPETANYNRGAYSTGSAIGTQFGGFDAKQ